MSGEHGDGLLRTPLVERMYGEELYRLFADVKEAFDPQGVLNPGKKVGPQDDTGSLSRALRYGSGYRTLPQRPILAFQPGEYEREIEKCHGCAQCKSLVATTMCPVYKATRREQAAPRAKANLLRNLISGQLDLAGEEAWRAVKEVEDYCMVCGMCAVECPSNVDIPKLMLEAKSAFRAGHRGRPVEALLARAETVSRLGSVTAPLTNRLLGGPALRGLAEALTGIDRRRPLPRYARPPAGGRLARGPRGPNREAPGDAGSAVGGGTVAYFADLFAHYNDPEIARAAVAVLRAHGLDVLVPSQRSSGVPEMLYGYAASARRTAAFHVERFAPLIAAGCSVAGSEPTATFAFKVHYPDYLGSERASALTAATHDLGELLVRRRAHHPEAAPIAGPLPLAGRRSGGQGACLRPLRIAYHLPCHLKAQQIGAPALELLAEIPGVEIVDLAAGCCGMAGTFGMKKETYELSLEVGRPLFTRVAETAPDLIATECSTCRMQLTHATGIASVHPIVLLAAGYGVG